jgi:pimeloyl-ACP methyl ester carboxylesterase
MLGYQLPISLPLIGPLVADRVVRTVLQAGRGPDRLSPSDVDLFAEHVPPATTVAMYRTFLTREVLPLMRGRFAHRRLEVPTRLLAGERDAVTLGVRPGPVARQPNLDVEIIPRVAHWVPEQRPDTVVDFVLGAS